jgi:FAD:protein FMN transferase
MWKRSPHERRIRREPVLGTVLELYASGTDTPALVEAENMLMREIDRLEAIFSVYLPDSELRRWQQADGDVSLSSDLVGLLRAAGHWHERTGGIFNPSVGVLTNRWKQAEAEQAVPSPDELLHIAVGIAESPYEVVDCTVRKVGDCRNLNFNAFAKGLVVDRAAQLVFERVAPTTLLVNIGGDLVHVGEKGALVAVEDPHRPYDNAQPIVRMTLRNAGFATSGSARRGFTIGGSWFSHVIDPRSGQPVADIASASVLAKDAATADVLATVASVVAPEESLPFIEQHHACGFVIMHDRSQHRSERWTDHAANET